MTLGEYIKDYRKEHGLTIRAFAERAKLSFGYISMIEKNKNSKTGKPPVLSIENFKKIADATGKTVDELLAVVDKNTVLHIGPEQEVPSHYDPAPQISTEKILTEILKRQGLSEGQAAERAAFLLDIGSQDDATFRRIRDVADALKNNR